MKELIGVVAAIITFVAYAPYIRDAVRGKTRPHIFSWFIWSFVTFLVFALQFVAHGGPGTYTTLAAAILCTFIFLLGLKNGKRDITKFDVATFVVSLIATGVWIFAKQPVISTLLLVVINTLATLPTIRKSWQDPHSETLFLWEMAALRNFLGILALSSYSILTWLYPAANVLVNLIETFVLVYRRRGLKTSKDHNKHN